nr:hypothetical protein [Pseudonocardia thermophila]
MSGAGVAHAGARGDADLGLAEQRVRPDVDDGAARQVAQVDLGGAERDVDEHRTGGRVRAAADLRERHLLRHPLGLRRGAVPGRRELRLQVGEVRPQLAHRPRRVDALDPFGVLLPRDAAIADGGVQHRGRLVAIGVGDAQLDVVHDGMVWRHDDVIKTSGDINCAATPAPPSRGDDHRATAAGRAW